MAHPYLIVPFDYSGEFNTVVFNVNIEKREHRYPDESSSDDDDYGDYIHIYNPDTNVSVYCSDMYGTCQCDLCDMDNEHRESIYESCTNKKYYNFWKDYYEKYDRERNVKITEITFKARFCLN
jgi:hypothetical protein